MTQAPAAPVLAPQQPGRQRRGVTVRGVVQGVGFRPFVVALAGELGLAGHVSNTGEGVVAEVEGDATAVADFCRRVSSDAPPLSVVESVTHEEIDLDGGTGFHIAPSRGTGVARTLVPPDTATCADCLTELTDPHDRRYRHPFITCTHCGPRFTLVTGLPYDRANTTMARFPMCARCAAEYADPTDRRFHAQPVSCHDCGPRLSLRVNDARTPALAIGDPTDPGATALRDVDPLARARRLLRIGAIVAVKGVGGYHLACDATNDASVRLLRRRKARGDKPFAVMARTLTDVRRLTRLSQPERELLTGNTRPIVLLRRHGSGGRRQTAARIADSVAPGSPDLGVMLPYTPLHKLLLGLPEDPCGPTLLVMTSGNHGGQPIVTDDQDALDTLAPLVDAWLTHDRPIHVPCDDSVVRVHEGEPVPLRRSRGYAPATLTLPLPVTPALAVGGDLKNAFCLGEGRRAWLSAHIGDMDDLSTQTAADTAERHLTGITGVRPELLVADQHPGYRSTRRARARVRDGVPVRQVQHHHAHVASVLAEHGLDGGHEVIGVAFDGTGYGTDGAVWGGEFLLADYAGFRRFAHLAYAPLPGGDTAVRHPYRMALAHLYAAGLPWSDDLPCVHATQPQELQLLERQLERGLNTVPTSSMGRLFDAAAALLGVCHTVGYEAQAAMELEACAHGSTTPSAGTTAGRPGYRFDLRQTGPNAPLTADPAPLLAAMVVDLRAEVPREWIAARFHRTVAELVRTVCAAARDRHRLDTVALTGGVFANALLSAHCAELLRADGHTVLRNRLVPPGDGGLALGQLMVAARSEEAPEPAPAPGATPLPRTDVHPGTDEPGTD
ncbi:carbamoyltransferase HypF [Streptomyces oceani]|uniref:Carbamoyltransferase n=1 Tax=Streptomyces oceani TaxID=1075402 RepID=A0A1E7JMJ8_9ACTN|nr:carbamoyltransferase HypF [Streptomyces oceani]OEU89095.1 hydrogenase maturation protein HypF [Streptomyces oceani]